ncbi:MAG TPA: SpoIIE family protein phosphatase [Thermoanaerobaculia bacterium]|nr:SpoIIE family protein phosphatase [Thermoanaerobaculia bacterium]
MGSLLVGCLLAAVGLLALVLSLFRRHRFADPVLASFGGFTLLYGVRLFFQSPLLPAFGVSEPISEWVDSLVTYVINIPAWAFFWKVLGDGRRSFLFKWLIVVSAFAVVGVGTDLVRGAPQSLTGAPNNLLVIAGFCLAIAAQFRLRGRMTSDQKLLAVGFLIFGAFALNDNLMSFGILPWTWHEEAIGFIIFLGFLGTIAARRAFAGERQLAALEGELEAARRIQTSILPRRLPEIPGLKVAARFRPSSAVAGDLYDFLAVDAERLGLVVADVSGHGVPAALIASMVKVAVSSRSDCADDPARLLTQVNRTLCGSFESGFVTATYLFLDPARGKLVAANAGHPAPILLRASGELREIGGRGPILGRFASARFQAESLDLTPGDRLVLYTDGLTEALDTTEEMFGEARLEAFVRGHTQLAAETFCDALLDELRRFTAGRGELALEDDLTLVVVDVLSTEVL